MRPRAVETQSITERTGNSPVFRSRLFYNSADNYLGYLHCHVVCDYPPLIPTSRFHFCATDYRRSLESLRVSLDQSKPSRETTLSCCRSGYL